MRLASEFSALTVLAVRVSPRAAIVSWGTFLFCNWSRGSVAPPPPPRPAPPRPEKPDPAAPFSEHNGTCQAGRRASLEPGRLTIRVWSTRTHLSNSSHVPHTGGNIGDSTRSLQGTVLLFSRDVADVGGNSGISGTSHEATRSQATPLNLYPMGEMHVSANRPD